MAKKKVSSFVFHKELIQQMLTLSTSAFGLAAALAWNETIQQTVKEFIEPRLPGSGILSRFIYAILVTLLGVIITFQLSRLAAKWGLKK
ncbi:hypothetical protein A3J19_01505 [Candidatus Daviesbacteria bacterium RIFCSPLOWO2_02_FULL_41_8]|uniref:Uncharacterized protein n=3 Tax=Candidatus Daviesiibacteriota TaxID=1752718 RepID=A0A1F5NHA2_9BACT|nr:MAG: hypothetical protein A2871_01985 [Candidatus Daviesbacteria bacterium RIFCSPHIGHO2_01_FULL_41_23]OGE33067.1 MAG: hypothetical protein A3D83_02865 [Candidatus Daviesbacteria bacterium RIFCSPHIGHO2_02_FULL_41_10]OGE77008.1 MAG: hypothetical protein A3J19_01505 [Candidatus Daviesbacteria bacterium RIFCSPLOWO2_02_FULL_41_8]